MREVYINMNRKAQIDGIREYLEDEKIEGITSIIYKETFMYFEVICDAFLVVTKEYTLWVMDGGLASTYYIHTMTDKSKDNISLIKTADDAFSMHLGAMARTNTEATVMLEAINYPKFFCGLN